MSGVGVTILMLFAAVNPPAVLAAMSRSREGASATRLPPLTVAIAFLGGAAILLAATFAADAFLDVLELEPETFRISAAIVMAVSGAAILFLGPFPYPVEEGVKGALFPFVFPLLASPAAIAAVLTRSVDKGEPQAVLAALIVVGAVSAGVFALSGRSTPFAGALARLIAALLIVRAVGLLIDGIRAV